MYLTKLSKELSYILRHSPQEYGLELDKEGWVNLDHVFLALSSCSRWNKVISISDIEKIVYSSDKKRFEIKDGKIRAFYGHSVQDKIYKSISTPPDKLYHGTAQRFVHSIEKNGLVSMNRQYVHLSTDISTANDVGHRRDGKPVIFEIDTVEAVKNGVNFYFGNDNIWLSESIPYAYLKKL